MLGISSFATRKNKDRRREREGRLSLPFNVLEHHTRFERSNLSNLHWSRATKSIFLRLPASSPLSFFIFIFFPLLLHRMDKTRSKAWLVPLRAGTNRGGPSTSPNHAFPLLSFLSFLGSTMWGTHCGTMEVGRAEKKAEKEMMPFEE